MPNNKKCSTPISPRDHVTSFILPEDVEMFQRSIIKKGGKAMERITVKIKGLKRTVRVESDKNGQWHPSKLKAVKDAEC